MSSTAFANLRKNPKQKKILESAIIYAERTKFEETVFLKNLLNSLGVSLKELKNYVRAINESKK
uniref:Uncharacterized protein n=1 Tax=viral metagenome TaxID=1070528 RepID=A0A6M3LRH8_9ZZZZ